MSYFKKLDITIFSQGTGSHRQKDKLREVHKPAFCLRPREYPTSKSKILCLWGSSAEFKSCPRQMEK